MTHEATTHGTGALAVSDESAAKVAIAPRVSLEDLQAKIAKVSYCRGPFVAPITANDTNTVVESLACLTICIIVLDNGFCVVGKSAPASPKNFDAVLGQKLAYDDAVRQIWPLLGFDLRERLHRLQQASAV